MTKIKVTRAVAGHKANDVITVTRGAADFLTRNGYAEPTTPTRKAKGRGEKVEASTTLGGDSPEEAGTTAG